MIPFSGFKKIKDDQHSAVLQHPEGHHIVVAKSGLSPKMREALKKLPIHAAEGADIPDDSDAIDTSQAAPQPSLPDQASNAPFSLSAMFGGDADQNNTPPPALTPQPPKGPSNYQLPTNAHEASPQSQVIPMMDAGDYQKAVNQQKEGVNLEAQAQSKLGNNQARDAAITAKQLQDAQNDFQKKNIDLMSEYNALKDDVMNGHITPDHYMQSMSDGKKVSTAIGLILGGIGSGFTGGPNPALQFLNNQIDRDIQSQKDNLGKKESLLSMNLKAQGNLRDAMDATRIQMMGINSVKFQQAAAASQDPMAKARAQQASSLIDQAVMPKISQMALTSSVFNPNQKLGAAPSQIPPEVKVRYIPNEKDKEAAVKELAAATETQKLRADMQDSFNDLNNQFLKGVFSPSDRESARTAFAGRLAKIAEGRFNLQEAGQQADALLPAPRDLDSTIKKKQARLNALFDTMITTPVLNGYGIAVPKVAKANQNNNAMKGYNPMGAK